MDQYNGRFLQRVRFGEPMLQYSGDTVIDQRDRNRPTLREFTIFAAPGFHNQAGCTEACQFDSAFVDDGEGRERHRRIGVGSITRVADSTGEWSPGYLGVSVWTIKMNLRSRYVVTEDDRVAARQDGSYKVTKPVTLRFKHTSSETIAYVPTPGRETTSDENTAELFPYTVFLDVKLTFITIVLRD